MDWRRTSHVGSHHPCLDFITLLVEHSYQSSSILCDLGNIVLPLCMPHQIRWWESRRLPFFLHASREVRHGRLTRAEGLALVGRYEESPLQQVDKFCEWLAIDLHGMQFIIDLHRNRLFWEQSAPRQQWARILYAKDSGSDAADLADDLGFHVNSELDYTHENNYVTIGKGYPIWWR